MNTNEVHVSTGNPLGMESFVQSDLVQLMFVENQILSALGRAFLQTLKELDMEPIADQLKQDGWTCQQAMCAIARYKLFLVLVYLHPHTLLVPTQEIDRVWHCHILHTRKYFEDCQMLFG
jgi:hypothetical protein